MQGMIINPEGSTLEDKLISQDDFLESIEIGWAMMETPAVTLTLPSKYGRYISGNSRLNLRGDDWVYEGHIESKDLDTENSVVTVVTTHVMNKLSKRTMPTNITLKAMSVKEVIEHTWEAWKREDRVYDFVNEFKFKYVDGYAEEYIIEYEFSNEPLFDFLTKVCEKSPDLYWRINRYDPYLIEIGTFGQNKDIYINEYNYLVSLDNVLEDYSEVTNVAVVMSDKSDSGASSLTLRDIFYNKKLFVAGFPVFKTGNQVNSQRHYKYPQIPQFAPEIIGDEFAIMDEVGVAMEAGEFYWNTIVENDTQAIADDNEPITNDDRIKATIQLYQTAIRRLINSRRKLLFNITVEPLPNKSVQVGDKVMFSVEDGVWELTPCTKYYEKILKANDWFYITKMNETTSEGNSKLIELELSKFLYSDRDITATT